MLRYLKKISVDSFFFNLFLFLIQDLTCMIERYLEPLKQESFLTHDDIDSLFGNIQEILVFQKIFLQSLEQAIEGDILTYNNTSQFRVRFQIEIFFFLILSFFLFKSTLFSIGGSFLYYGNHFKVYSSFCASHSKAQKLLNAGKLVLIGAFSFSSLIILFN